MLRLYKPARDKHVKRGYFSYLTESVFNLLFLNNEDINKYYHDLTDIWGYGTGNIFDVCFTQDSVDYINNINEYINIEKIDKPKLNQFLNVNPYDLSDLTDELRLQSEKNIKQYFKLNDYCESLYNERIKSIDFTKTIGVHRRATDISGHFPIVSLENIFKEIDSCDFSSIFLMCDNKIDYQEFKERYGDKIICYDVYTSDYSEKPFYRYENTETDIKNHITELVLGTIILSKVKLLICSKSNLSTFSILSNSKLKYKILE
jgi:hypothetical protein